MTTILSSAVPNEPSSADSGLFDMYAFSAGSQGSFASYLIMEAAYDGVYSVLVAVEDGE